MGVRGLKIKKTLERPTLIAGVEMGDLFLFLIIGFGSVIVLSLVRTFLPVPSWINILLLGLLTGAFIWLRKLSKKNHSTFLKSTLFWYLSAPRKVIMNTPKIIQEYQTKKLNDRQ